MINAFVGSQIFKSDPASFPSQVPVAQTQGLGLSCPNGLVEVPLMTLAPASSGILIPFPNGATAAVFIAIFSITVTDLVVKTGSGLVALPVLPYGQCLVLYGLTSSQISLNSVLGGTLSVAVGG